MGEGFASGGEPGKAGRHQAKSSAGGEPSSQGDLQAGMGGGQRNLWKTKNPTWPFFWGKRGVVSACSCYSAMRMGPKWDECQGLSWLSGLVGWRWRAKYLLLPMAAPVCMAAPLIYCTWAILAHRSSWIFLLHSSRWATLATPGMKMWGHRELSGGTLPGLGAEISSRYNWVKKTQSVL